MQFIANFTETFFKLDSFRKHDNFLYFKVHALINETLKYSQQWIQMYTKLNAFVTSDQHIFSMNTLFLTHVVNKQQNKLSTKIVFWLMDKEISKKSETIIKKQKKLKKLKFLQIYLQEPVSRELEKEFASQYFEKWGRLQRKVQLYVNLNIRNNFRVSEQDLNVNQDSMTEIEFKQCPSRGLTIVSDPVYDFLCC